MKLKSFVVPLQTNSGIGKPFASGTYTATFEKEGRDLHYVLEMTNSKVIEEEFVSDGVTRLQRASGGRGTIYHEREGRDIEFQSPDSEVDEASAHDLRNDL